jgi:hypothetical protein
MDYTTCNLVFRNYHTHLLFAPSLWRLKFLFTYGNNDDDDGNNNNKNDDDDDDNQDDDKVTAMHY